jgi:hypothetical protein
MLCLWHINNNIKNHARPLITQQIASANEAIEDPKAEAKERWNKMLQRWNRVVFAETVEEKDRRWTQFKQRYSEPLFADFLEYVSSHSSHFYY